MSAPGLVELEREECLTLLAGAEVGRVVVAGPTGAPPIVRPVVYGFDEESQSVVFRTAEGSKLHALMQSRSACFEIDGIDPVSRSGWSVIVAGVTEHVTAAVEVSRLERLGLHTWVAGARGHWIRVRARSVSGRRVVPIDEPG